MKTRHTLNTLVALIIAAFAMVGCAGGPKPLSHGTAGPMDNPDHLVQNGEKLRTSGSPDEAAKLFERALSVDNSFVPAMVGMAWVESDKGNLKAALEWANKARRNASGKDDRQLAAMGLMKIYLTFKPDGWLADMEGLLKEVRRKDERPGEAVLLMGKGYEAGDRLLKAAVCYRQVIDWKGDRAGEADGLLEALYKRLRAEPGTVVGRTVAAMAVVNRGDVAALLVEELKFQEFFSARETKTYTAKFQTPQAFAKEKKDPTPPPDVVGHPYEPDICTVLQYGIRGLEVFPDGNFHPAEPMRRANFALVMEDLLGRIKEEPLLKGALVGNTSPFPDVAGDHYALNAMIVCTTRNLLATDLDGAFRPDAPVTGTETLLAIRKLKSEIRSRQVKY